MRKCLIKTILLLIVVASTIISCSRNIAKALTYEIVSVSRGELIIDPQTGKKEFNWSENKKVNYIAVFNSDNVWISKGGGITFKQVGYLVEKDENNIHWIAFSASDQHGQECYITMSRVKKTGGSFLFITYDDFGYAYTIKKE